MHTSSATRSVRSRSWPKTRDCFQRRTVLVTMATIKLYRPMWRLSPTRSFSVTQSDEIGFSLTSYIFLHEQLRQTREWVCSVCGGEFYNAGCVLTGLTLDEIIKHSKEFREKAFS